MRFERAGARPGSLALSLSLSLLSFRVGRRIDEESYHGVETRDTERRKENTLAGAWLHGVTRKYDAPKASRRGTKRPRRLNPEFSSRGLLGGSTRNTLSSSASLLAIVLLFFLSSIPLGRALLTRSRSPLRKSVQDASRKGYHTPGLTDHPAI